jgi:hypothetical protein
MHPINRNSKVDKIVYYSLFGIIVIICLLAIIQFFFNRSLWIDEAMLASSIIHRDILGLFNPLEYGQVAPILFLLIQKYLLFIFFKGDIILRILPLLCYLGSVFYVFKLTNLLISSRYTAMLATSLFCLSPYIFYFGSECKQYIPDTFVSIFLTYQIQKYLKNEPGNYIFIGMMGAVAIFLSNVAIITLSVNGIIIAWFSLFGRRKKIRSFFVIFFIWAIAFLVYYIYFVHNNPAKVNMVNYWQANGAFMPKNIFSNEFSLFFESKIIDTFSINFILRRSLFLFTVLTIIYLFYRRNFALLTLFLGPFIIHLVLSLVKIYPFAGRLTLYQLPGLIIIISIGLNEAVNFICIKISSIFSFSTLIITGILLIRFLSHFPIEKEEIKMSISDLKKNIKDGDLIFCSAPAINAYQIYKDLNFFSFTNKEILGKDYDDENDFIQNKDQLEQLKGRVWFVFSHMDDQSRNIFIEHLKQRGGVLVDTHLHVGSSLYLLKFE